MFRSFLAAFSASSAGVAKRERFLSDRARIDHMCRAGYHSAMAKVHEDRITILDRVLEQKPPTSVRTLGDYIEQIQQRDPDRESSDAAFERAMKDLLIVARHLETGGTSVQIIDAVERAKAAYAGREKPHA